MEDSLSIITEDVHETKSTSMEVENENLSEKGETEEQPRRAPVRKNAIPAIAIDLSEMEPKAKQPKLDLESDPKLTADNESSDESIDELSSSSGVSSSPDDAVLQVERVEPVRKKSTHSQIGLACPSCSKPFMDTTTPQTLPECHHVICNHCLSKMTRFGVDSTIKCPQCRRTSSIANGGTAAIETNMWLQELSQLYHMGKLRNRMDEIAADMGVMKIEAEKTVTDLKMLEKDTQESSEREVALVDRSVQAAQSEGWVLKAKIRDVSDKRLNHIRESLKHLQDRADNIGSAYDMLTEENEHEDEIQYDKLADKLEEILSTPSPPQQETKSPQVVRFLREKVSLGRVIRLRNLELASGFKDNFVRIQGLAVTPDGLLVVCDSGPNGVTVYCKDPNNTKSYPIFKRKLRLSLNKDNHNKPTGVAATPDGKYLVARQTGVEVYSTTGAYVKTFGTIRNLRHNHNLRRNPPQIQPCIYSVTVLDGDKILAGDITRNVITVHNLKGDILASINAPIKPWCMAPAMEKHLVAITDWRRNKLCVMHVNSGSVTLKLDVPEPLGVCYDKGSDSFLLGRGDNLNLVEGNKINQPLEASGVIEQHNSNGDRTIIVCLAQDMQSPTSMVFLDDNLLAVADLNGVKVYRVT